jgi:outer membrane protein
MFRLRQLSVLPAAAACFVFAGVCAAQMKVGVINLQKSVVDTAEIKKAQTEMEARYKPRQEQMDKLQKDIQGIQNQLQTLQGKLNSQGEAELTAQGQRKQRELQRISEDLQADVDRERNDILSRSSQRMQEVVRKLAEERGLDLVVDITNTFYFKPALEITKEATAAYDKAYPLK